MVPSLNDRERQVLEAVIETYVETAEPAGSRTISKRFGHTLSAATIRNTMSDLEEKGYLYHPHTSAGRIPTDLAYRVYVNSLMRLSQVSASDSHQIREELAERNAVDQILERAAQVLGVLTRSEEHTSELQSPCNLVCRLLLEKKKIKSYYSVIYQTYQVRRTQNKSLTRSKDIFLP